MCSNNLIIYNLSCKEINKPHRECHVGHNVKLKICHNTINNLYYIFEAILILFIVIFEDDKSDNFLRGDKSFRTLKRTESRQKRANDVTSKHQLRHFRTSLKVKLDIFVNVIYKLILLLLKIQEIFPSGLANLVNKLVHAHSFVYMICNSLGKYFLYFQPKVD